MRKPVFAICEQQRCKSACASVQSDQSFVVHCLDSIIPILAIAKSSTLASLCSWAGQFESTLVANPAGFYRDEAQTVMCRGQTNSSSCSRVTILPPIFFRAAAKVSLKFWYFASWNPICDKICILLMHIFVKICINTHKKICLIFEKFQALENHSGLDVIFLGQPGNFLVAVCSNNSSVYQKFTLLLSRCLLYFWLDVYSLTRLVLLRPLLSCLIMVLIFLQKNITVNFELSLIIHFKSKKVNIWW